MAVSAAVGTSTDVLGATAPALTFRPDIEGLRAVAVGLVVLLHAGVTGVSGGYIGVDVFFVISGFLITSLLVDEVHRSGRVSMLGFYARRARRILPLACFVIVVTVVAAYLQLGPLVGKSTAVDGRWAAVFAANFRFIHQGTDYFASAVPPSPLQHYWSLAVEEQFYLVWPALLFLLVAVGKRAGRALWTLRLGLMAVVAASFWWSVHVSAIDRTSAYFSPVTRAWELGAGALVAVFSVGIARVPATLRSPATWAGLALVLLASFILNSSTAFPGSATLLPVGGAALVIAGGIGGGVGGAAVALGLAPVRWLGRISYSVYLWHWPVLVIAEERSASSLSGAARVVCVLITLALSYASYTLIEAPLRSGSLLKPANSRTDWERARRALSVGLVRDNRRGRSVELDRRARTAVTNKASSVASGQSGSDIASAAGSASTPTQQAAAMAQVLRSRIDAGLKLHAVPSGVDPAPLALSSDAFAPEFKRCLQHRADTSLKPCTFGVPLSKKVLVAFGDSHIMQWMAAIDEYAKKAGYRLVTLYKEGCSVPDIPVFTSAAYPECPVWKAKAFDYIASLQPAAIVIGFSRENTSLKSFDLATWLSGLTSSLAKLRGWEHRSSRSGTTPISLKTPVCA